MGFALMLLFFSLVFLVVFCCFFETHKESQKEFQNKETECPNCGGSDHEILCPVSDGYSYSYGFNHSYKSRSALVVKCRYCDCVFKVLPNKGIYYPGKKDI